MRIAARDQNRTMNVRMFVANLGSVNDLTQGLTHFFPGAFLGQPSGQVITAPRLPLQRQW